MIICFSMPDIVSSSGNLIRNQSRSYLNIDWPDCIEFGGCIARALGGAIRHSPDCESDIFATSPKSSTIFSIHRATGDLGQARSVSLSRHKKPIASLQWRSFFRTNQLEDVYINQYYILFVLAMIACFPLSTSFKL
jgi:hypothetical protein